jgi:hypothetical protein
MSLKKFVSYKHSSLFCCGIFDEEKILIASCLVFLHKIFIAIKVLMGQKNLQGTNTLAYFNAGLLLKNIP